MRRGPEQSRVTHIGRPRKELRARAPDFAGNRAAGRKSKSYVGQAVLEGKLGRDLEAMFPLRKAPASRVRGAFRANSLGNKPRARSPGL
jgi:hypothetical protein